MFLGNRNAMYIQRLYTSVTQYFATIHSSICSEVCQGIVGCNPTNIPLKSLYRPYVVVLFFASLKLQVQRDGLEGPGTLKRFVTNSSPVTSCKQRGPSKRINHSSGTRSPRELLLEASKGMGRVFLIQVTPKPRWSDGVSWKQKLPPKGTFSERMKVEDSLHPESEAEGVLS